MLPGFRFVFAASLLTLSLVIFGFGAAALLRASHDRFAGHPIPMTPPSLTAKATETALPPTLSMLRVEPATPVPALAPANEAPTSQSAEALKPADTAAADLMPVASAPQLSEPQPAISEPAPEIAPEPISLPLSSPPSTPVIQPEPPAETLAQATLPEAIVDPAPQPAPEPKQQIALLAEPAQLEAQPSLEAVKPIDQSAETIADPPLINAKPIRRPPVPNNRPVAADAVAAVQAPADALAEVQVASQAASTTVKKPTRPRATKPRARPKPKPVVRRSPPKRVVARAAPRRPVAAPAPPSPFGPSPFGAQL